MSGSVQSDAVEGQPLEGHSDQDDWSKVEAPSEVYSASMVSSSTSGSDNEAHQQTATAPSSAPAQASGALIGAAASASTSGRPSKPAPARPAARPRPPGPSPPVPSILSKASPEITPTEPRFSRQASQLTQEARPTTAPSAGGGWGSWNSWGITSTLRSAAAEAAKDMRDFSTSFQQALNAEDSDDEARPAQVSSPSRTVQSRETHRLASDNPDNLGPEALAQRQEVLRRLQGHDTSLEVGLKVRCARHDSLRTASLCCMMMPSGRADIPMYDDLQHLSLPLCMGMPLTICRMQVCLSLLTCLHGNAGNR